jgi:hypothetical protein
MGFDRRIERTVASQGLLAGYKETVLLIVDMAFLLHT